MLKAILAIVVLAILVIVALALTKPASYHVERSITIHAAPEKIAPLVYDFHNWDQWSPWAKLDPAMKVDYSGAAAGVGAVYHWKGNSKVGEGEMKVLSTDAAKTSVKLDFLKPFESHNISDFNYTPAANGDTVVRWTMDGPSPFMTKVMMVFTTMDKMIGPDFEKGLAQLKIASERQA